jgi:hypothetical protein
MNLTEALTPTGHPQSTYTKYEIKLSDSQAKACLLTPLAILLVPAFAVTFAVYD